MKFSGHCTVIAKKVKFKINRLKVRNKKVVPRTLVKKENLKEILHFLRLSKNSIMTHKINRMNQ
jgi:hypothetical protein